MGCCGSKSEKPPAARQVTVGAASSITAGQTPTKDSSKEREPEIELDAHLEALANNMDFVSTVLQSSFVSENESLREQFDLALKETTPQEIDEANDTYFTPAEQETALQKFGFISGPIAHEEEQRRSNCLDDEDLARAIHESLNGSHPPILHGAGSVQGFHQTATQSYTGIRTDAVLFQLNEPSIHPT